MTQQPHEDSQKERPIDSGNKLLRLRTSDQLYQKTSAMEAPFYATDSTEQQIYFDHRGSEIYSSEGSVSLFLKSLQCSAHAQSELISR